MPYTQESFTRLGKAMRDSSRLAQAEAENRRLLAQGKRLAARMDAVERYQKRTIGNADSVRLDKLIQEKIERYTRSGTFTGTYEQIREEAVKEFYASVGRTTTRPEEAEIDRWVAAWKKAHGLEPGAATYPAMREDAAALLWAGFTVDQVKRSGLSLQEAAVRARMGMDLPQLESVAERSGRPQQYSRGRQSDETAARVRDRIEHYSRRGQWKPYAEIVAEVEGK